MTVDQPERCPICRAPMTYEERVFVADVEGEEVRIEDVPTWVCERCDHFHVPEDVVEAIDDMLSHLDTVSTGKETSEEE